MLVRLALLCGLVAALAAPGVATASPSIRYGVQDDAWIADGNGTLPQRLDRLRSLGVQIVRYNLRWDQIAAHKPKSPSSTADPAYDWSQSDVFLKGLRAHGIAALVTIYGTPGWANGGHGPSWAPKSGAMIAAFAHAAAKRYPWVKRWAKLGDVQAGIDDAVCDLRVLHEWVEREESEGVGEAPYPPNFPKMPGEPRRVQPSRARRS